MHKLLYVLVVVALVPAAAHAADWTAVKLRGLVFANTVAGDGLWVRLKRGDVVDDARVIRTLGSGNVEFRSGDETIAFGPGTQAEIVDRAGRRYTTVAQQAGTVSVSAEALDVQHFSVETPYLVAVVKGTVFSVSTGAMGSGVSVARGLVAVTDRQSRRQVLLQAGRSIVMMADGRTALSGTAIPALVHPRIGGVIEDADPSMSDNAGAPTAERAFVQSAPGFADQPSGPAASDPDTGARSSAGGLGQATGVLRSTVGTVVGVVGNTVGGLGQATIGVGTTAGASVGNLGGTVGGLGSVTGPAGNAVSTATTTLGNAVSSVGAGVTNIGSSVKNGAGSGGTLGSAPGAVTGTVGGVLSHLGL